MGIDYRDVQVTQREPIGFTCDKCGESHDSGNFVEMQESVVIKDTGGYGSVWGDGSTYEVALCQRCAYDLFGGIATIYE